MSDQNAAAADTAAASYPSAEEAYAMAFGASAGAAGSDAASSSAAAADPAAASSASGPSFPLYQPTSYAGRPGDSRVCDQCGLTGHLARQCPETMVCRKCGGPHEQKNCPDLHRVRMDDNETDVRQHTHASADTRTGARMTTREQAARFESRSAPHRRCSLALYALCSVRLSTFKVFLLASRRRI